MDAYLAVVSKREFRDYAARPLAEDAVRRILDAGRVAGSSKNRQARRFVVLRSPALVERAAKAVYTPSNLLGAALVVALVTRRKGPLGFDAGRAAQNMMLAAWNEGIGSCPNGVADPERMRDVLEHAEWRNPDSNRGQHDCQTRRGRHLQDESPDARFKRRCESPGGRRAHDRSGRAAVVWTGAIRALVP